MSETYKNIEAIFQGDILKTNFKLNITCIDLEFYNYKTNI